MQLDFFPSRRLTIYMARMFAVRILAVLVMLVLVLQTLDLLGESGDILAAGNGQAQLWTYVGLRAPQLVARFLPYSVLLATIIMLLTLNQNSEVISMKAAGLSAHQILAPMILTALAVAVVNFGFNERIVTRGTATLNAWQAVRYHKIPMDSSVRTDVWMRDGDNLLYAEQITGTGTDMVMTNVTWYGRDQGTIVRRTITSPRATWTGQGWRLEKPQGFDASAATLEPETGPVVVAAQLGPREVAISRVDGDGESIFQLRHSINALNAAGRRTESLTTTWWHKLASPFSSVLMPLLGAMAAFGLARSGQLFIRALIGMALGFTYFVVDNFATAMGNMGAYPPILAAWAPFILFALIGEAVLIRTEE